MKTLKLLCAVVLFCAVAFAQGTQPKAAANPPADVASILDRQLSGAERRLVSLAEAMPEEKYSFAPSEKLGEFKGVRTFQEQLTHVAATNYEFGGAILGEKPPVDLGNGENGPVVKSKAEAVKLLKDSFEYVHKAIGTINASNLVASVPLGKNSGTRLGLAVLLVSHANDHYGQCVVYARMNGVVPPASRR